MRSRYQFNGQKHLYGILSSHINAGVTSQILVRVAALKVVMTGIYMAFFSFIV